MLACARYADETPARAAGILLGYQGTIRPG
jgi:hypothetical protein